VLFGSKLAVRADLDPVDEQLRPVGWSWLFCRPDRVPQWLQLFLIVLSSGELFSFASNQRCHVPDELDLGPRDALFVQ
jgi:hypothetical protein